MKVTLEQAQRALRTATEDLIRRTDRDARYASRDQRETQIADAALAVREWAGVVADAAGVDVSVAA